MPESWISIDLDKSAEPLIAAALSMPGTLIENVPPLPGTSISETDPQEFDLTDGSVTENTRFAYPLAANPNVADGARGPHPRTIVLLTADAFGVLPPVSILEGRRDLVDSALDRGAVVGAQGVQVFDAIGAHSKQPPGEGASEA